MEKVFVGSKIYDLHSQAELIVVGETSRSWLCRFKNSYDWMKPDKIPKKAFGERYTLSLEDWIDARFSREQINSVVRAVQRLGNFPPRPENGRLLRGCGVGWVEGRRLIHA